MKATDRRYYVVGPGPLTMRDFLGDPQKDAVPYGCYAVAVDDERGPRLLDGCLFHTRDDAQRHADWQSVPD